MGAAVIDPRKEVWVRALEYQLKCDALLLDKAGGYNHFPSDSGPDWISVDDAGDFIRKQFKEDVRQKMATMSPNDFQQWVNGMYSYSLRVEDRKVIGRWIGTAIKHINKEKKEDEMNKGV